MLLDAWTFGLLSLDFNIVDVGMLDVGLWIHVDVFEIWILDLGCVILDFGLWTVNFGLWML